MRNPACGTEERDVVNKGRGKLSAGWQRTCPAFAARARPGISRVRALVPHRTRTQTTDADLQVFRSFTGGTHPPLATGEAEETNLFDKPDNNYIDAAHVLADAA